MIICTKNDAKPHRNDRLFQVKRILILYVLRFCFCACVIPTTLPMYIWLCCCFAFMKAAQAHNGVKYFLSSYFLFSSICSFMENKKIYHFTCKIEALNIFLTIISVDNVRSKKLSKICFRKLSYLISFCN